MFFLIAGRKGLKNKTVKAHIGSLYSGIDLKKRHATHYVTLFLFRRAIIGVSIAFFRSYFFVQLEVFMISSMVCLCFLLLIRPYKSDLTNAVEMINESLVICTVYILHGFSVFIPSSSWRFKMGWIYVGIVAFVFLINLIAIFRGLVMFVVKICGPKKA